MAIGSKDDQPLSLRYDPLMTSTSTSHFDAQFQIGFVEHLTAVLVDCGRNRIVPQVGLHTPQSLCCLCLFVSLLICQIFNIKCHAVYD